MYFPEKSVDWELGGCAPNKTFRILLRGPLTLFMSKMGFLISQTSAGWK